VILGAGLGGTIMAYELRDKLGKEHQVSVVSNGSSFFFVPSNPWVGVGWRDRKAVEVALAPAMASRDIELHPQGARRLDPASYRIELNDGGTVSYDYLVIATGPELAFDEIEGLGPQSNTQSVCHIDHALQTKSAVDALVANPGPVIIGAVQGASCFGPAYEFAFILDKALRDAKVRDRVLMTFVTSEPYIGHLGLDGVGDTRGLLESELRQHHIKWICNARVDKAEGRPHPCVGDRRGRLGETGPRAAQGLRDAAAGVPRRRGRARYRGPDQPARFHPHRQVPAKPGLPGGLRGRGLCGDPADGKDAGTGRGAEDRLHDRIDGHCHRS